MSPSELKPIWLPTAESSAETNVGHWIAELGLQKFADFHRWSVEQRSEFWRAAAERLGIRFQTQPTRSLDESLGPTKPIWFPDAKLNIVESCFSAAPDATAIIAGSANGELRSIPYAELQRLSNQVANSLADLGCKFGDAIAVVLPMTAMSVPIYLGIIQAGCVVVSIADSFAPPEIATRLKIANAKWVFTYDYQIRAGKKLPLYAAVRSASEIPAIVLPVDETLSVDLREHDRDWDEFLVSRDQFQPIPATPFETINILFSSGTTGEPKAIPWTHLTPIKCAMDGYCHQDIRPGDVCTWPTNLGWMMGPWLIFATLINRGTIGLYEDAPMGAGFGRFVQDAAVTMLGVVPTIVKAWKASQDMEPFDWSAIRVFSSTGEASQAEEMAYLSSLAGGKPIIEYCGGTEIGGGYISSSLLETNYAAAFNTPAIGSDFVLLDERGEASDDGEAFLIPPTIGLSNRLVNRDHWQTYYADVPIIPGIEQLRRHGDHFRRIGDSVYVAGGRVDDTMNLGGIKVSSAELERVLNSIAGVVETAAVADDSGGGAARLIVFAVVDSKSKLESEQLNSAMNGQLRSQLNPLFKVSEVRLIEKLPRTASGKIMRRELRSGQ